MARTLKPLQDNWQTLLLVLTAQASQEEINNFNARIETCIDTVGTLAHHEPILEGAEVMSIWRTGDKTWKITI